MCRSQRKNGSCGACAYSGSCGDFQIRLLEHIRVVDPSLQPAAQAQVDHPLEPVAIAREQLAQRFRIAGGSPAQQIGNLAGIFGHDSTHTLYKCEREPIVSIGQGFLRFLSGGATLTVGSQPTS